MFIIPALKFPLFHYSSPENLIIPLFPKNQDHYSIIPLQKFPLFLFHYSQSKAREVLDSFSFEPVSSSHVRGILDHLNLRKAVGVDGISPRLLRLSAPVLADEIAKLINYLIASGIWPFEWKCGNLTPVFKKVEDTCKGNYHPVSILTALSKVYEKVMYDQMYAAFYCHLSFNLSGFLKNHSCCTALLKMTEDWRRSLDNREVVAAVAVDLSKAFDSINHNLLLAKLKAYGFSASAFRYCLMYSSMT